MYAELHSPTCAACRISITKYDILNKYNNINYRICSDLQKMLHLQNLNACRISGAFTLHGEEDDGISSLDKISAFSSEMSEIRCSSRAWPSEIL